MDEKTEGVDVVYKILLLGESSVGKTSIIQRYIENKFDESNTSTCGIDFKCKYVSCDDKKIRLDKRTQQDRKGSEVLQKIISVEHMDSF